MAVKAGQVEVDVVVNSDVARGLNEAVAEAEAAVRKIGGMEGDAKANLDVSELVAKAAEAEAIIKALNGQDVEVDVDVNDSGALQKVTKDLGRLTDETVSHAETVAKLRSRYAELYTARKRANDVDFGRKSAREKLEMDKLDTALLAVGHRIRSLGGDTRDLNIDLDKNRGFAQRARSALSTLGKTRLSIGPISTSFKGLGVILGTLGPVLVNLVGSAGALVGVVGTGLAGAFAVGAGAVGGFGLAVAGLLPSLKALFAEAKAAPAIGGALAKMRDSLTGGIRPQFFEAAHAAIKTLQSDFPTFQRGADSAFKAASTGFQTWMKGLRSPEAKGIISDLLGNFTKSIPGIMQGLGSIGTTLAHIGQSGSKFLPSLSGGFAQWAANLERSIGSGDALDRSVGRLVGHMRDIGHFAQASGSLLTTFFNAGANSGDNLLRTFTATEKRWTAWMHTVGGQRSLQNFFSGAVENTKAFFSALAPLLSVFVKLSNAFTPLSTGALKFATALTSVTQAITSFGLGKVGLEAIGASLAAIWTVSKVNAFAGAIRGAAVSLGLLSAAETTAATGGAALGAEAASGQLALAGMETAGTGLGIGLAAAFALPVAGAIGLTLLFGKSSDAIKTYHDRLAASAAAAQETATATKALNAAQTTANKLAQDGQQHTEGYRSAVVKSRVAEAQRTVAVEKQRQAQTDLKSSLDDLQKAQELVRTTSGKPIFMGRSGGAGGNAVEAQHEVQALAGAFDQFHLAQINVARTTQGMAPILQSQARLFGILRAQLGKGLTAKIGVSGTPAQAAQIGRLASQLKSFAGTKAIAKILVSDEGAKAKISQLQSLLNKTDRPHHTKLTASTNKGEVEDYLKAAARADTTHTTHIRADTGAASGAISSVIGLLGSIPSVVTSVINVVKHVVGGYEGGAFPGYAGGGSHDRMMALAYASANRRSGLDPSGGAVVRSPRYITGEEPGRTEYIITDNPAYKRSNLDYLAMAASALGQMIVPGYGHGGAHASKKSKNKKGSRPFSGNLDNATASDSDYQRLEDQTAYDASIAELVRRRYDLNQGPTINDVVGAIGTEISDYQQLLGLINGLISGPAAQPADVPPVPKKAKTKGQKKAKKKAQIQHDAATAHNDAIKSDYENLLDEARTIQNITIPGLQLDQLEAQNAAVTNTVLGQETSNQARYDLYKQFASNLAGGPTALNPTAGQSSYPALPSYSSGSPTGSTGLFSASPASSSSPASRDSAAGSAGVTINQTFAAPPPDAHTWAQNTVFEIAAAGA